MEKTEESDLYKLFKKYENNEKIFTIGTTVDTGLEWQAVDECKERINSSIHIVKERGKIYFNISMEQFSKILREKKNGGTFGTYMLVHEKLYSIDKTRLDTIDGQMKWTRVISSEKIGALEFISFVQEMRSIDNIFVISDIRLFNFSKDDADSDLQLIKNTVNDYMRLEKGLEGWKTMTGFRGRLYPEKKEFEVADKILKAEKSSPEVIGSVEPVKKGRKRGRDPSLSTDEDILKYRVTCERTGSHAFESGQVARVIGGELQDKYNWLVDLTMYHLEIVCNVVHNQLITSLRVTHESKHRRNIVHFGPTTLRATVSYSLIKLANPKEGEIVMDPMCGGGSIPIEAGIAFPNIYVLSGDNHEKAISRSKLNIDAQPVTLKIDLVNWSVTHLPLKDSYIDVVVTDMPFGKRSGTMTDNRILYKRYITELARVVKIGTGRLVLMTYDRRSIQMALQNAGNLFKVTKMLGVNMGGLHAAVYVLKRTKLPHDSPMIITGQRVQK